MRDIMKTNSIISKKNEWIVPAAIMFVKALLVLPLFENIYSVIIGNMKAVHILANVAVAALILVFSVLYSLMLSKSDEKASVLFLVFAVADPLITVTVSNLFYALTLVIALIWMIVSIRVENRIVVTAVSAVSAAVISFIMPCAIFTFVLADILVAVISDKGKSVSKAVTGIVSAASAVVFAVISSGDLRLEPWFIKLLYKFGSTENHAISAGRLEYGFSVSDILGQFGRATVACLPFVIFAVYVVVNVVKEKNSAFGKAMTAVAILLPFAGSLVASALCYGTGGITAFIFAPLAVILALMLSDNKAVIKAVGEVCEFSKNHPAVAVAAIIWISCHTMSFVTANKVFGYAAYFSV